MLRSLLLVLLGISVMADAAGGLNAEQIGVIQSVLQDVVRSAGAIVLLTDTSSPVARLAHFENRSGGLTLEARAEGERDIVVSSELWRMFRKANSERTKLAVVPAVSDVLIASPDRLKLLLSDASSESWERFHSEWPRVRAVVRLATPAISLDGRTAVIYATVTRGPLDGEGTLFVLEREGGVWSVKARYIVIAS